MHRSVSEDKSDVFLALFVLTALVAMPYFLAEIPGVMKRATLLLAPFYISTMIGIFLIVGSSDRLLHKFLHGGVMTIGICLALLGMSREMSRASAIAGHTGDLQLYETPYDGPGRAFTVGNANVIRLANGPMHILCPTDEDGFALAMKIGFGEDLEFNPRWGGETLINKINQKDPVLCQRLTRTP